MRRYRNGPKRRGGWDWQRALTGILAVIVPVSLAVDLGTEHTMMSNVVVAIVGVAYGLVVVHRWRRARHERSLVALTMRANTELTRRATRAAALADAARVERDQFYGALVHQLKSPLAVISGYAELLSGNWERFGEDERRDRVEIIGQACHDVTTLVDDGLDIARASVGGWTSDPQVIDDLDTVLRELVARLGPVYPTIVLHPLAPPSAAVRADTCALTTIVQHFVDNAMKYGTAGTPIVIDRAATAEPPTVTITVTNTTPANSRPLDAACFGPFVRPNASSQPGVGLGLYLCEQLAHAMHGGVEVHQDAETETTTFELSLPDASSYTDAASEAAASLDQPRFPPTADASVQERPLSPPPQEFCPWSASSSSTTTQPSANC